MTSGAKFSCIICHAVQPIGLGTRLDSGSWQCADLAGCCERAGIEYREAAPATHFLYDSNTRSTDPEYNAYWCSCGDSFGADKAAAAAHLATVTPDPLRDKARRLLAEFHQNLERNLCGSLRDQDLWISEAADLLERIAGES